NFFFFQAEDGIRDFHVTGVQTCALPISRDRGRLITLDSVWETSEFGGHAFVVQENGENRNTLPDRGLEIDPREADRRVTPDVDRSEERRVGKECRSRWSRDRAKHDNEPQ